MRSSARPGAMRLVAVAVSLLWPGMAAAADPPTYCDPGPNTITFDLGHYRGGYRLAAADGSLPAGPGWQSCPAAAKHAETPFDDCAFSLCGLPDGEFGIQVSPVAGAQALRFRAAGGMLKLVSDPRDAQGGHFTADATAAKANVTIDLDGYAGPWRIGGWPGAFHGAASSGRGQDTAGAVTLGLYWDTPYALSFGDAEGAILAADRNGLISLSGAGRALRLGGPGRVALRTASFRITPAADDDWLFGGAPQHGPLTVTLPASSRFTLRRSAGGETRLTLDVDCRPALSGAAGFSVTPSSPSPGCS